MVAKLPAYFEHINLLRAFAALTVLVYHVMEHMSWQSAKNAWFLSWFAKGWMGVDIFFVLSGFVISLVLGKALQRGKPYAESYLRHRFARIVPLHWLTCVVFVLIMQPQWLDPDFWEVFGVHMVMLQSVRPEWFGAINGPNWSVAVEVQFYLLMLMIVPWVMRASYVAVWLGFVGAAWVYKGFYYWALAQAGGGVDIFYLSQLIPMLDVFVWGVLLAKWVLHGAGSVGCLHDARMRAYVWLGAIGLSAAALMAFWMVDDALSRAYFAMGVRHVLALAFACWLWLAVAYSVGRVRVRSLPYRAGSYLGEISYGIYLWHLPMLLLLKQWGVEDALVMLVLCATASIALAAFSWHCVERPIMRRYR